MSEVDAVTTGSGVGGGIIVETSSVVGHKAPSTEEGLSCISSDPKTSED